MILQLPTDGISRLVLNKSKGNFQGRKFSSDFDYHELFSRLRDPQFRKMLQIDIDRYKEKFPEKAYYSSTIPIEICLNVVTKDLRLIKQVQMLESNPAKKEKVLNWLEAFWEIEKINSFANG
jgi:hypothetical protein